MKTFNFYTLQFHAFHMIARQKRTPSKVTFMTFPFLNSLTQKQLLSKKSQNTDGDIYSCSPEQFIQRELTLV